MHPHTATRRAEGPAPAGCGRPAQPPDCDAAAAGRGCNTFGDRCVPCSTRIPTWSGRDGVVDLVAEQGADALPVVPRSGPYLAADFVATVRERSGLALDYSPGSLALVDRIIDGLRRGEPQAAHLARTLLTLGAYTGEVLVRSAGAVWVEFDTGQRAIFGQPLGVRTPDGRLWNPLGKAVKRYENGSRDSLRLFCLAVAGRTKG